MKFPVFFNNLMDSYYQDFGDKFLHMIHVCHLFCMLVCVLRNTCNISHTFHAFEFWICSEPFFPIVCSLIATLNILKVSVVLFPSSKKILFRERLFFLVHQYHKWSNTQFWVIRHYQWHILPSYSKQAMSQLCSIYSIYPNTRWL